MKRNLIIVICMTVINFSVLAQKTSIEGLYHYTLENGLELFVAENNTVPLTYIELAVKGGGISQTKETVGLFHLYEHMIFKGNEKYRNAASVQRAINDLGVPSWNGSTGNEYVNYFFTVPSNLTKEGLEFWSHAIRSPLLDEKEFENEKSVVIAELEGGYSEPSRMFYNALYKYGFPETPWQFDPGGDIESIQNAQLEDLIAMKNTYYVPNNCAIFVGGNVKHREVFKMVKDIYGSWEKSTDPWESKAYLVEQKHFQENIYLVQANPQMSSSLAQVGLFYRGPDTEGDIESTYVADMFLTLSHNPSSKFTRALTSVTELKIPNADYTSTGFLTARTGSIMSFSSVLLDPSFDLVNRSLLFQSVIGDIISPSIIHNENYFTESEYANAKTHSRDSQVLATETAKGQLSMLRYFWASADSEYYLNYIDNLELVSAEDISTLFSEYIQDKATILTVTVNPEVYASQKKQFDEAGFILITGETAFWWKTQQ